MLTLNRRAWKYLLKCLETRLEAVYLRMDDLLAVDHEAPRNALDEEIDYCAELIEKIEKELDQ
jgi:hypothetical protein